MNTGLVTVRRATAADVDAFHALIDDYARGHPAEHHPRPVEAVRDAYFGVSPDIFVVIAEQCDEPVGFGTWRRVFDPLWAAYGGEMDALFVKPAHRSRGIAASIVAAICDDIRREGGVFLRASYTQEVARLYERVAIGRPRRECHLSAGAFQAVADLARCGPREMLRRLPSKQLNLKSMTK
jgi:GNAT superfamily N-acetyltransferase